MRIRYKLIFHFLILFILFQQSHTYNRQKKKRVNPLYSVKKQYQLIKQTNDWKNALLLQSYVTGEKENLDYQLFEAHKKFYLMHLFTPSALHLSIILSLFTLITHRLLAKRPMKAFLIVINLIFYLWLPDLHAIHRVTMFNILTILFAKKDRYLLLMFTFIIDCVFGGYAASPTSFHYSFLFLGVIVISHPNNFLTLIRSILIAHFFLAAITLQSLNLSSFFLGFTYTTLFSSVFPLFVIYYYLNINFLTPIITLIFSMQKLFFNIQVPQLLVYPNFLIFLICLIFLLNFKTRKIFFIFILIFYSTEIINFPNQKYLKGSSHRRIMTKKTFIRSEYYQKGIKIRYKNRVCYHTLYNTFYKKRCRKN